MSRSGHTPAPPGGRAERCCLQVRTTARPPPGVRRPVRALLSAGSTILVIVPLLAIIYFVLQRGCQLTPSCLPRGGQPESPGALNATLGRSRWSRSRC